ncbi:hypothetical protein Ae201684P_018651 [Aphanomyces euteiches]|nr:hypothetical protein Ae201684P_018651 [Aphanomyces euteiches]
MNSAPNVEVNQVAWAKSEDNPWWPVYICDPSKLRTELHLLGSGHRRMLRKANERPTERYLAFYFGLYLFRLHAHDDNTLRPWECIGHAEFVHGLPKIKRGPVQDSFRTALREARTYLASDETTRLPPRMVASDLDPSMSPPALKSSVVAATTGTTEVIDIDSDENEEAINNSSVVQVTADDLKYDSLAWLYVVGKTWWPAYICDPKILQSHSRVSNSRTKVVRLAKEFTTEIQIAQSSSDTHRLLYLFGTHTLHLHDTTTKFADTGIKIWNCNEYDQYFPNKTWSRKDEAHARAMKEVKDFLACQNSIRLPPYISSNVFAPKASNLTPGPQESNANESKQLQSTQISDESGHEELAITRNTKRTDNEVADDVNSMDAHPKGQVHDLPPESNTTITSQEFSRPILSERYVAWACLNGQMWWPVYVCAMDFESKRDAREEHEVSKHRGGLSQRKDIVAQVYFFGRHKFGLIESESLKQWKGAQHTDLIYDQSFVESKSKAFVEAFAAAVAEAENFEVAYQHLLQPFIPPTSKENIKDVSTNISGPQSGDDKDEPPRKKQAVEVLPNALKVEFAKLSVMQREFESRTQDSSKSQNVAHTPGPEIQDVSVVSPQTVPHVDSNQYGVDTTFTFETYSLGLHIGETKHGAVVLGLASNAPQQTKYAIEWGTIAPGDFIAKVNSRPYTEIGYKGFSDLVASGKRPLSVTFRRPVRNPIVSHDKPKSATPSASRSNANNKATSQRVTLIEEVTPQERPNVNGFEHRVSTNDYESQFSGRSSVSVRSSYATPFIASTNCTSNPSTSSQHNRRLVNTNQASQNLVASSAMPTPSTSMNYYDVSSNIGNLQSVANTQIFPTFLGGGSTNQVGQPPFSHIPFSPQVPPTAAGNDAVFFNPSNVPALGYHGNYGNQAPYFPPQSVMIVAVPPGHPLYNSMLLQSLPTYPAPPELPPQYQNHNPSYFNYPPSNGFFP